MGNHLLPQAFGGGDFFFEHLNEAMVLGGARPRQPALRVGQLATE
jgi:hypothetical protein